MTKEYFTIEQATEKIAREISINNTGSEEMWELFLIDAYREYYNLRSPDLSETKEESKQ